jgi:hypothetical protein
VKWAPPSFGSRTRHLRGRCRNCGNRHQTAATALPAPAHPKRPNRESVSKTTEQGCGSGITYWRLGLFDCLTHRPIDSIPAGVHLDSQTQRCQLRLILSIKARRSHLEESNAVGRATQISLDCSPVGIDTSKPSSCTVRSGGGRDAKRTECKCWPRSTAIRPFVGGSSISATG